MEEERNSSSDPDELFPDGRILPLNARGVTQPFLRAIAQALGLPERGSKDQQPLIICTLLSSQTTRRRSCLCHHITDLLSSSAVLSLQTLVQKSSISGIQTLLVLPYGQHLPPKVQTTVG